MSSTRPSGDRTNRHHGSSAHRCRGQRSHTSREAYLPETAAQNPDANPRTHISRRELIQQSPGHGGHLGTVTSVPTQRWDHRVGASNPGVEGRLSVQIVYHSDYRQPDKATSPRRPISLTLTASSERTGWKAKGNGEYPEMKWTSQNGTSDDSDKAN